MLYCHYCSFKLETSVYCMYRHIFVKTVSTATVSNLSVSKCNEKSIFLTTLPDTYSGGLVKLLWSLPHLWLELTCILYPAEIWPHFICPLAPSNVVVVIRSVRLECIYTRLLMQSDCDLLAEVNRHVKGLQVILYWDTTLALLHPNLRGSTPLNISVCRCWISTLLTPFAPLTWNSTLASSRMLFGSPYSLIKACDRKLVLPVHWARVLFFLLVRVAAL